MFLNKLMYDLRSAIRSKALIGWLILFPILLGLAFKLGFDNIYEEEIKFSTIKTAVVEKQSSPILHTVTDSIAENEEPLFTAEYTDEDTALKMLENEEIEGIIYADEKLSLTVAKDNMEQTVLKSFVEQYNVQEQVIRETIAKDPGRTQDVISALSQETHTVAKEPLTEGNVNVYVQYFYNLIAMVALCGAMTGVDINSSEMPNLTALGARNVVSPMSGAKQFLASFTAAVIVQGICAVISVSYIRFLLGIDLGDKLGLIYLTAVLGSMTGVSIGFFASTVIRRPRETITNFMWIGTMSLCFLSGLMAGNMKSLISEKAPIINDISPVALVCDSMYCLNICSGYDRYIPKMLTLAGITALFALLSLAFSRRKKYASI